MVARRTERAATYAEIEALPPNLVGEIIGGILYASPRPASPHARAATTLGEELGPPFNRGKGGPGGWILLDEPELHLGPVPDIVVPDLAGWRRERMPELPDTPAFTLAPDWLCEVLSPSTTTADRTVKLPVYARERVAHVWFIDPRAKTLEILRLDGATYRIVGVWNGEARVRGEPFDAIEVELGALWAR